MSESRTANSLKNIAFGLGSQLLSILMGFFTRWMFIEMLGKEYLGVSGLFTNVLSLLSLANLGFNTAIIYSLYKPLAEGDTVSVKGYMQLYRKVYSAVGAAVFLLGCALLPFLPRLINGEVTIPENLYLIYMLFLLQSSASYFFSYKQALLTACQQGRVISAQHSVFMVLRNAAEMLLLFFTRAYIPVLVLTVLFRIAENVWIARVADKRFPFINDVSCEGRISAEQKNALRTSVKAMLLYKISGTVTSSTDNIIISKSRGLVSVGLYSNYVYIVDVIRTFLSYIFYSLTPSVGNYSVSETKESNARMYYLLFFASFWIYGFTAVCLGVLLNPFIRLWIGESFLLPPWTVAVIILNYYTEGMQYASITYREVTGLFKVGKYRPLIAAGLNLVISVALVRPLGIAGVLIGTVASRLSVYFWFDPYIIHKKLFGRSVRGYFAKYGIYAAASLAAGGACLAVCRGLTIGNPVLSFLVSMLVCAALPNLLFMLLFHRTREFAALKGYAVNILRRLFSKGRRS